MRWEYVEILIGFLHFSSEELRDTLSIELVNRESRIISTNISKFYLLDQYHIETELD